MCLAAAAEEAKVSVARPPASGVRDLQLAAAIQMSHYHQNVVMAAVVAAAAAAGLQACRHQRTGSETPCHVE